MARKQKAAQVKFCGRAKMRVASAAEVKSSEVE